VIAPSLNGERGSASEGHFCLKDQVCVHIEMKHTASLDIMIKEQTVAGQQVRLEEGWQHANESGCTGSR
jgi:hypothetical protein